jgi:cell wall-associated NlpC family hydrolase
MEGRVPIDRRQLLGGVLSLPLTAAGSRAVWAQAAKAVADFPAATTFQTGDLLWPKKKGSIVPRSLRAASPTQERRAWEAERERAMANPDAAGLSPDVAERLRTMPYEEFERLYYSEAPGRPAPGTRSAVGGRFSVGHVAIVELTAQGVPYVVEATPEGPGGAVGVIRTRYAEWLKNYSDVQVWHGRLRNLPAATRRRVLDVAKGQLGKPYDFFNFDLNDDRGFYCSKLVWMSLWRAASIAADGRIEPRRGTTFPPWFSPKQLIAAQTVEVLHKPGDY